MSCATLVSHPPSSSGCLGHVKDLDSAVCTGAGETAVLDPAAALCSAGKGALDGNGLHGAHGGPDVHVGIERGADGLAAVWREVNGIDAGRVKDPMVELDLSVVRSSFGQ